MADYIDRNEVIAALTEFRDDQTVSKYVSVENCMVARGAIERSIKVLESLPAADVEPVRHGRWIRRKSCHTQTGFIDRCSVCQKDLVHLGYKTNFCPNCGAKMDGGAD